MILSNARLILPEGIREGLEVVVTDGKIAGIRERSVAEALDLGDNYLAPGFIDLHIHGALGRDTMDASLESFRAICDYHASGGTTSLLLTTSTAPIEDIVAVLRAVRKIGGNLPPIRGVHVEGPFLSRSRPGAQRGEFIRNPDHGLVEQLLEFADVIKRVTLAPELPGVLPFVHELRSRGIAVSGGHSDAWEEDARAAFEHGMRHVTHTFNCMSSARRRGIYRVAGLLEFALSEPEITCELIADGYHVLPALMKMLYHAKSCDGICLVTDATAGAGMPEGSQFKLSGVECKVAGGVCLLADGSALAGSASRMIDLVRTLVRSTQIPLHHAVTMATRTPARTLGLTNKGKLEVGADADFAVLSADLAVLQTFVGGQQTFPSTARAGSARSRARLRDG